VKILFFVQSVALTAVNAKNTVYWDDTVYFGRCDQPVRFTSLLHLQVKNPRGLEELFYFEENSVSYRRSVG
jgi:hypothetical protein